jgi:phosphoribosylglycinamide formyltransferase-1
MKIRAGILGSSGGSALAAAVECARAAGFDIDLTVVVDRDCGLATWAADARYPVVHVPYKTSDRFSAGVLSVFREASCYDVLLFYTRRVSDPLISGCRVWNIHPSLLPAFPGLHGVRDAARAGAKQLGATLHRVDAGLDTGPTVGQMSCAMPIGSLARAERLSYLQKVYLTMAWFEMISGVERSYGSTSITIGRLAFHATTRLTSPALLSAFSVFANDAERSELVSAA